MSQTDRQTDKATHWKSGIFDVEDNWTILQAPPPPFIKYVKFKKEICPTTGKEHFQTHVCCHKQVRLSQMSGWLKHTKWFAVIGDQHIQNSINYIDKKETTAPGAQVQTNHGEQYFRIHELFLEIAKFAENDVPGRPKDEYDTSGKYVMESNDWDNITLRMVSQDLKWASKLANPSLRRMWNSWKYAFISKVSEWTEETGGAFIIEGTPPAETPAEDSYEFLED